MRRSSAEPSYTGSNRWRSVCYVRSSDDSSHRPGHAHGRRQRPGCRLQQPSATVRGGADGHTACRLPFLTFYLNSALVTVLAVTGQLVSATLVAYGFARFRFPFRGALFMLVIATLIVPWEVTIVPSFILYRWLGWLDSLKPLIVPFWFGGSPLYIFLLRQFFMGIPREFDEAAEIDGASSLRILTQILVPLSVPALTTVAIFSFLQHWNEFIQPLIFLNSPEHFTVSLGLRYFQTTRATLASQGSTC